MEKLLIQTIRKLNSFNRNWLSAENKMFFGDIEYQAWKQNSKKYFIQHTKRWSDTEVCLIREIKENGAIGEVIHECSTMSEAYNFISKQK